MLAGSAQFAHSRNRNHIHAVLSAQLQKRLLYAVFNILGYKHHCRSSLFHGFAALVDSGYSSSVFKSRNHITILPQTAQYFNTSSEHSQQIFLAFPGCTEFCSRGALTPLVLMVYTLRRLQSGGIPGSGLMLCRKVSVKSKSGAGGYQLSNYNVLLKPDEVVDLALYGRLG